MIQSISGSESRRSGSFSALKFGSLVSAITSSPAAFALAYPEATCRVVSWGDGSIKRKGDTLTLTDPNGDVLATVTFSNTWFDGATYNTGYSLVTRGFSVDQTSAAFSLTNAWRTGSTYGGTPGRGEVPFFTFIDRHGDGVVTLKAKNLEDGPWELRLSRMPRAGKVGWSVCPAAAYTVDGDTITVTPQRTGASSLMLRYTPIFFKLFSLDL